MRKRDRVMPAVCGVICAVSAFLVSACSRPGSASIPEGPTVLQGAGATGPNLAYSKWIEAFNKEEPNIRVQYEATGSGAGIDRLKAGTVDFAASDIPLSDDEIAKLPARALHFPTLVDAIVPVYNVAEAGQLKFTGQVLAGIFSGKIKTWNDPAIAKTNPGAKLPASRIIVVHRSDASGSTNVVTDYLSKVSPDWKSRIGTGATVRWPPGEGVAGSAGMASRVKSTPNSIGYVELNYAVEQKLEFASVQNHAGKFVRADLQSLGAAVDLAQDADKDFRVSIVNSPAAEAYPISTLTWIIVPGRMGSIAKQKAMKRFMRWAYQEGQKIAMPMEYGVLQPPLLDRVRDQVDAIGY